MCEQSLRLCEFGVGPFLRAASQYYRHCHDRLNAHFELKNFYCSPTVGTELLFSVSVSVIVLLQSNELFCVKNQLHKHIILDVQVLQVNLS